MARVFDIIGATGAASLDAAGRGSVMFTVTNTAARVLRGRFKVKPLDAVGGDAIAIEGEPERSFNPNDTQQVSVRLNVPPGTQEGSYRFRLDAMSVDNPDEDFTEGPVVAIEVKPAPAIAPAPVPVPPPMPTPTPASAPASTPAPAPAAAPAAASTPATKKSMPWWIYAIAVLVLAAGGVAGYLFMHKTDTVDLVAVTGPFDKARQELETRGLVVARVDEPTAAMPPGEVIGQSPTPAEQPALKKGSTVTLTVAVPPAGPAMVELPQVTETSWVDASKQLQDLGLVVKRVDRQTTGITAEQVIGQAPKASKVAQGSTVTLTVAVPPAGPAMVDLPQVTEMSYDEASKQLEGLGLDVQRIDRPTTGFTAGQVVGQAPKASKVAPGTIVTLSVAVSPASPFVGTWVNRDRSTARFTRLVIESSGDGFKIHAFARCPPAECDRGLLDAKTVGNELVAFMEQGYAVSKLRLAMDSNALNLSLDTTYRDARPPDSAQDSFVRPGRPVFTVPKPLPHW